MGTPKKPSSVPSSAKWKLHESFNQFFWTVGKTVNGLKEGPYQYYRKDGTLCLEVSYVNDITQG